MIDSFLRGDNAIVAANGDGCQTSIHDNQGVLTFHDKCRGAWQFRGAAARSPGGSLNRFRFMNSFRFADTAELGTGYGLWGMVGGWS